MLEDCQVNNFKIVSQVGSGVYGLVFHVYDTVTKFEFAMKAILKSSINSHLQTYSKEESEQRNVALQHELFNFFQYYQYELNIPAVDLQSIKDLTPEQLSEIPQYNEIWMQLQVHSHKNIVTIHQVLESSVATFLIMDYHPIDLFTSIVNYKHFESDGQLIKKVFNQVCSALEFCHKSGIYHCDIKPENILLDKENNAYLCDFGLSTSASHLAPNTCIGSTYYIAPEKILYTKDNESSLKRLPTDSGDVWSLGILLINLTCMRNPWLKAHQTEDKTFRVFSKDSKVLQKILPISDEFYEVLFQVLQINPYERTSIHRLSEEIRHIKSFTKEGPLNLVSEFIEIETIAEATGEGNYEYKTNASASEGNVTIFSCDNAMSSCATIEDNDNSLKKNLNLTNYTVISSETTGYDSDIGEYSSMYNENDSTIRSYNNDKNNKIAVDLPTT